MADQIVYTSHWDGLSPHLIATFYEVARNNDGIWEMASDTPLVKAPLAESNMELTLNWQSPFENAGPESKAPTLLAMLQSGALQPLVDAAFGGGKKDGNAVDASAAQQKSNEFLKQFEGRTGITKLNSTQVFTGMPPVKIQVTALFRAWRNPKSEVHDPVEQLVQWSLPQQLSADGSVLARAVQAAKGEMDYIDALLPSKAPVQVAMHYKGRTYSPMVIESIGQPIGSPVDANGRYTEMQIPMTLCTLTAIDGIDWAIYGLRKEF